MSQSSTEVILTLQNLSKVIGSKTILDGINLGIHAQDKIGLVGINGSGKSTLLKLIADVTEPSAGTIVFRNELKLAYLPQDPVFDPNSSIIAHIVPEGFDILDPEIHTYKAILSKLGFKDFDLCMGLLSGGQKRKADLARVIASGADILLLDEPTNHLDLDSIEWLQDYLAELKKTVLFVTHDRYFLDAIATGILELHRAKAHLYDGNYSAFVKAKILREIDTERKETRRKAQLKKELDWLNRGARARATKPKHHVDRVKELISKSYLLSNTELDISFQTDRLGKTILELHKLGKSYGSTKLFSGIDHLFQAKERIGIIGANGCGKTTLLKIIMGEQDPDLGSVKVGVNTHFSYYKQEDESFDPKLSVYEYIAQYAEVIKTREGTKLSATEMLNRFLFDGAMQQMKLQSLSGGERKRLHLLKSLMFGANFIILDEPTNDLDLRTLEILEDYLDAFGGCLLVVSHDRFFLDRTIDYLFIFEEGKIRKFAGNYSDYLLVKKFEKEEKDFEMAKPVFAKPKKTKSGLNFNQQMELKALENEIASLENSITCLEAKLNNPEPHWTHQDYQKLSSEYQSQQERFESVFERWAELCTIAES